MKNIYSFIIFLIIGFSSFSQVTHVQIRTNNSSVLVPVTLGNNYGTQTTDPTLNTIFQNNQVYNCYQGVAAPVIFAICSNLNLSNLVTELSNYTSLVTSVRICPQPETYADRINITLLNVSIGTPIGFDTNGVVITNDNGLNAIFQNFSVKQFSRLYPTATGSGLLARTYDAMCDCDVSHLRTSLDAYASVIENSYYMEISFLGIDEFDISNTKVYPNPFSSILNIDSRENISNYSIIDVSGKELINSNFKNELDNETSKLKSGVYFLKLRLENGKVGNYKLVKE
jgi:hypothetical protein